MRSALRPVFVLSIAVALGAAASAGAQTRSTVTNGSQPPAGLPAPAGAPGAPGTGTGTTVNPVTVQPQATPQGRVVSSTDATSITSPNYSPDDAAPPPRAVSLGGNAAAGVQTVVPSPPSGLPASMDPGPKRSTVGVTTVF